MPKSVYRRYKVPRVLAYGNRAVFADNLYESIWKRDKGLCVYCGEPAAEVDHVVPYSKGGPTIRANGVLSCYPCNHNKKAKLRLEQLTRAFYHLLNMGENLSWLDEFWGQVYELQCSDNQDS